MRKEDGIKALKISLLTNEMLFLDHLMSLCDKLEAGLMRSLADSERLIRAVVGRMLAG